LFWAGLAGVIILGSFASGLYPALVLSSFRVTAVLKGKFFGSKSGIMLRRTLVGSQFIISVGLIAGTIMVFRQVSFMKDQELGYATDQILVIKSPRVGDSSTPFRMETFRTELLRHASIRSLAPSSEVPGRQPSQSNFIRNYDAGREDQFLCFWFFVDSGFFPTYDVAMAAGRNFYEDERMNHNSENIPIPIIVTEKTTRLLQFKSPGDAVKQLIHFGFGGNDYVGEIVGVAADFHQRSLKIDYDPIIFFPSAGFRGEYLGININMQSAAETIAFIEDQYRQAFPGNQFEYFFLDDYFNRQYAEDQQFGKVFGLFSALALLVAGLGLLGLSTSIISQRTKEIAVRKVLGATIVSMIPLFSKDFLKLIIIANLIALPGVYLLADRWLNSFAFRIDIGWIMFVVPAALLLVISLLTVSIQTIRTGSANPVKSLRSE
jgi:putative ABC transport system permease protein